MPHPQEKRILFGWRDIKDIGSLKVYREKGGYDAWLKLLKEKQPAEVIELTKASGLRGRGGAGFPTGMKWSFVPNNLGKPKYLCVNCDESEPGTCKDREIVEHIPHQLLEGIGIACYAVGIQKAFIYIRGEMYEGYLSLKKAIEEAYAAGLFGKKIGGSDFECDIVLHRGAGAYICGEESALLSSLEGERGFPRLKPPFPAVSGLYACPTVINNVETLATLPPIFRMGVEEYAKLGTDKSKGTRMVSLSGHVNNPSNFEIELGKVNFKQLIEDFGGGMRHGKKCKAIIPGGASAPWLTMEQHGEVTLDFEAIAAARSMAGSGAIVVMDEDTCAVGAALNLVEFFHEESCGKCSPCREGTQWLTQILHRIEHGQGKMEDLKLLDEICESMLGKTFCPLGDSATVPVSSSMRYFRDEYEHHIKEKCCKVGPGAKKTAGV
ncbi:MAG: NADH-quinone oxidoreductase subunit NuoF [Candidatus Eremiobacteraeota bacterium]|nr:NADH-quinone oxidoreductase subunit NuoF [Candidatus Eremiobacteraeota bacterium]MCW5869491.1 NADH-quinone oxidoreductase subunit NuoF [Candidatus Eremiobacteraeota bacterium]